MDMITSRTVYRFIFSDILSFAPGWSALRMIDSPDDRPTGWVTHRMSDSLGDPPTGWSVHRMFPGIYSSTVSTADRASPSSGVEAAGSSCSAPNWRLFTCGSPAVRISSSIFYLRHSCFSYVFFHMLPSCCCGVAVAAAHLLLRFTCWFGLPVAVVNLW